MESFPINITSTTEPLLPLLPPSPMNCSTWDRRWGPPYLHRSAHLDVQLYQDFYPLWVSLMVRQDAVQLAGEEVVLVHFSTQIKLDLLNLHVS